MIKKVQVATSLSKSPSLSSEHVPQQSLEDTESLPETDGESQQKPKNGGSVIFQIRNIDIDLRFAWKFAWFSYIFKVRLVQRRSTMAKKR